MVMVVSDLREFDAYVSLAGPSIVDRIGRVVDVDADNTTRRQLSSPTPNESLAVQMRHSHCGRAPSHRRRFARSRGIVDIQVVRIEVGRYRQRGGVDRLHTRAVYSEHQT